jgi:hypothetical protein
LYAKPPSLPLPVLGTASRSQEASVSYSFIAPHHAGHTINTFRFLFCRYFAI